MVEMHLGIVEIAEEFRGTPEHDLLLKSFVWYMEVASWRERTLTYLGVNPKFARIKTSDKVPHYAVNCRKRGPGDVLIQFAQVHV